ncbi:hypothetical protein [Helicobacter pylori]|nr:hypothetical protein [Helicobacter pylori]
MTNLFVYSGLDNTAFYYWIKNAQKQPLFFYHIYLILWQIFEKLL